MARNNRYDDSWHQPELQWLEDGIHILFQEIVGFVCNLFVLIWLLVKALWAASLLVVRKLN